MYCRQTKSFVVLADELTKMDFSEVRNISRRSSRMICDNWRPSREFGEFRKHLVQTQNRGVQRCDENERRSPS
jgi:hypothetical protein